MMHFKDNSEGLEILNLAIHTCENNHGTQMPNPNIGADILCNTSQDISPTISNSETSTQSK